MAADGNDVINGGDGNADTLVVAAGAAMEFIVDDTRLTNVENITVSLGASINLTGQTEAFAITGAGGAENIIGGNAVDTVLAGLGNDVLIGGIGADVLDGQAGFDTVSYADVTLASSHGLAGITGMVVDLNLGTGGYIGAAGPVDTLQNIEAVVGSALNDGIVLGNGGMSASGEAGNDSITAGIGADTVDGGTGNDVITVTNELQHGAGDIVTGGDGTDVIRYTAGNGGTLTLQAGVTGVEEVEISDAAGTNTGAGAGIDTNESINASALTYGVILTGNDGANTLTGSAFADNFAAGGGNDTIVADGADTVDGGAGTDVMTLAADATFTAARLTGVETVTLASDVDVTVDYTDTAAHVGGTGLLATVTGVSGGATENLIVTGASTNGGVAITNNFSNTVALTNASLQYAGGTDDERVIGTAASDTFNGGSGADTLEGGAGSDVLTGAAGADTFFIANTFSNTTFDTVTDFVVGTDIVDVTSFALAGAQVNQTNFGPVVTRTDGVTIESYTLSATGVVTLFDQAAGQGSTAVFAETAADVLGVANTLAAQVLTNQTAIFGLDSDGNGVADGSVIVSETANGLEIIQLNGVAHTLGVSETGAAGAVTVNHDNVFMGNSAVNTFTGGAGSDVFVIENNGAGATFATADTITDFSDADDAFEMGIAGVTGGAADTYVEAADADRAGDEAAILAELNTQAANLAAGSTATELYVFVGDTNAAAGTGATGYLGNDTDGDGAVDQVIILTGVLAAGISEADFI